MNWQPIITYRPFTVAIGIHYIQVFAVVEYREEAEELIRVLEFCKASFLQPEASSQEEPQALGKSANISLNQTVEEPKP